MSNLFSFFGRQEPISEYSEQFARSQEKLSQTIERSDYISRDLSWLQFNFRVLDQARNPSRTLFERLKFLAITASNLDEFYSIRVGSLYNYLDFGKERIDYSGLREVPFRKTLLSAIQQFDDLQQDCFSSQLIPIFEDNGLKLAKFEDLNEKEQKKAIEYFDRTIYPMLTPMLFDHTHTFPVLLAKVLIFGVITQQDGASKAGDDEDNQKLSFVQIPQNLPRFVVFERKDLVVFISIEEIIRYEIRKLYRNVDIKAISLFRITRNGDFTVEESDDIEIDFIDEIRQKIKNRRLGRVVRVEIEPNAPEWMLHLLKKRWEIDAHNIVEAERMIDFTSLWQIVRHPEFKASTPPVPASVPAFGVEAGKIADIFETIKEGDILLHHPYNNFEPVIQLLEEAADDPQVLAIKLTIYRLAKRSRITEALLKAAENGKHVSVLFEVKARFDEENNIREAQRLQKAGCFVIHGISRFKTHTKLLQVVRAENQGVVSYSHLASGNYNEDTARLYTDIGLLTADPIYNRDITEFFNVITGHSLPESYQYLITAPRDMRRQLIKLIQAETKNAKLGLPSGICWKINSLEDKAVIDELYRASQAGVPIKLIVRGICCIRPHRKNLSENISVRSIVGDFLEHTRIFYFHHNNNPKLYGGSADVMVRSFDRRIESLFTLANPRVRQQAIHILDYNLRDNVNSYDMQEDGTYARCELGDGREPFNIHQLFYEVSEEEMMKASLFTDD